MVVAYVSDTLYSSIPYPVFILAIGLAFYLDTMARPIMVPLDAFAA